MSALNVIFAGTPDFAVAPLKKILADGHNIMAVFTQPDRPAGRGLKLTPPAVKAAALDAEILVLQPENLKSDEIQNKIKELKPDVMVVVAYGVILPQKILDIPKYGCLNIHASILPRWRGAAPIQRAIEAQDETTGVSIMQMDAGLDTGDVLHEISTAISADDTAASLHDRLVVLGAEAISCALANIENLKPEPQDDKLATYAKKITKAESNIDWLQAADKILAKINAFNPWPVCQTRLEAVVYRIWQAELLNEERTDAGEIINITKDGIDVATSNKSIRIKQLQLPGKKAMSVVDFINSSPDIKVGQRFV